MVLVQILILLGVAVPVVLLFQRLRVPSSLAYLLVGVLLGPHTSGLVLEPAQLAAIAEFGLVFLLFTIGLDFSVREVRAMRDLVLNVGVAQVAITSAVVGLALWWMGLHPAAAFVVGVIVSQSSTTIIVKQLAEQGEENSRHGRLATATLVVQDVVAVPLLVVIPALGAAAEAAELGRMLARTAAEGLVAFALIFVVGRRLLRPLFQLVAQRRSAELFTLTVLLVSLLAGWATHALGLSMAFGAFLAGMILADTEFRHQVEAAIRPFRDVLLGLFFVGIGTLFDPAALPDAWLVAMLGAAGILALKSGIVALLVRRARIDLYTAWRTALLLAGGGEFGFALLSLGIGSGVLEAHTGQQVLMALLFSMVAAPLLIRKNPVVAAWLTPHVAAPSVDQAVRRLAPGKSLEHHVILGGYGRIGQSLGRFLADERIPYLALDVDAALVRSAHDAGLPVYYGDATQREMLEAASLDRARLLVITHDDTNAALRTLQQVRTLRPELPVMVRTRDLQWVDALRAAGATEVVPETLEAGLMIASQALYALGVPLSRVVRHMQRQRAGHYRELRELFAGRDDDDAGSGPAPGRLRPVQLSEHSPAIGRRIADLALHGAAVSALVRAGRRWTEPPPGTLLQAGDTLVLFGDTDQLALATAALGG